MAGKIRLAVPADAVQIAEIYAPYCNGTHISFETDAPSVEELAERIEKITRRYPWLVCERDGRIDGYAYASTHRERAAYRWSVDVAVYVRDDRQGTGLGRALYTVLFALLAEQGFCNAYAGIALPNPPSIGLHEAMGFQPVGVYRSVGYKVGAWRDVSWWGLRLREYALPPMEPADVIGLIGGERWVEVIRQAERMVRSD